MSAPPQIESPVSMLEDKCGFVLGDRSKSAGNETSNEWGCGGAGARNETGNERVSKRR